MLTLSAGAAGVAPHGPERLHAEAHGKHVGVGSSSYCVTFTDPDPHGSGGACLTSDPPLPYSGFSRRKLNVAGRSTVTLRFGSNPAIKDRVRRLRVELFRVRELEARRVGRVTEMKRLGDGRRWRLKLPLRLRGVNVMHVHAKLPDDGYADYGVGLRFVKRRRLACPGLRAYVPVRWGPVRGKRVSRAREITRERGCEFRVVRRNGTDLTGTADLRHDRVNVAVRDGRVARVIGVF